MNVKFKMPKFGRKLAGSSMLRELLLTTLATSISIVLTFGTATWIERRQKEKNRRQTTMMVISDILSFQSDLQDCQDRYFDEWKKDIGELQAMSRDSIMRLNREEGEKYWFALATPIPFPRDKTAANIFSSDISIWREVGNFKFIRMVGQIYSYIDDIEKNIKVKMDEKGRIANTVQNNSNMRNLPDGEKLILFMQQEEVQSYLTDFFEGFIPYIQGCIDDLKIAADRCMKIADVTQEELSQFMADSTE